jgi:hypothetical protein
MLTQRLRVWNTNTTLRWAFALRQPPGKSLVRYRNRADKSLHELRTAMHHHPLNQERALNLSILTVFGPGKFSRVESN